MTWWGLVVPIDFDQDDERRRVTATAHGDITIDDLLALTERQVSRGAWTYETVYDARSLTTALKRHEMQRFSEARAEQTASLGPAGPLVIIVASDEAFGMAQKYELATDDGKRLVFVARDVDTAEAWLSAQRARQR